MSGRKPARAKAVDTRRQSGAAKRRQAHRVAQRRRRVAIIIAAATAVLLVLGGALLVLRTSSPTATATPSSTASPSPVPTAAVPNELASVTTSATGQAVNGIQCQVKEQQLFHIHAHLAVYSGSTGRVIPAGVGIAPPLQLQNSDQGPAVTGGTCVYWLHTHTANGILHIEAPAQRTYTLGDFFALWNQPLGPDDVGPAHGHVTIYVNGVAVPGNPRDVAINAHDLIQLDVGTPLVPPQPFTFPSGD